MSHETEDVPEEVKRAADTLRKWSEECCAEAVAKGKAAGDEQSFAMSSMECPDGTFIVICGPEHAYCLEKWFDEHDGTEVETSKGPTA